MASAFPCGQYGAENAGLIQSTSRYFRCSSVLNDGPLSDFTTLGIPRVANILSNFGITVVALLDLTISTSGNLIYQSITVWVVAVRPLLDMANTSLVYFSLAYQYMGTKSFLSVVPWSM